MTSHNEQDQTLNASTLRPSEMSWERSPDISEFDFPTQAGGKREDAPSAHSQQPSAGSVFSLGTVRHTGNASFSGRSNSVKVPLLSREELYRIVVKDSPTDEESRKMSEYGRTILPGRVDPGPEPYRSSHDDVPQIPSILL